MKNALSLARAGLLALAILLMGSVFWASPASAHQGDITAVGQCQPDGTYLVTYTLSWDSVPADAYGTQILTRTDTDGAFDSGWEAQPDSYQWTERGTITSTQGSIQWSTTVPGTTLGAGSWEYAYLDWANGNGSNQFHDTRVEDLGGDCVDTTTPTPVTVNVEFGDNVCVGNEYTEPSLDAPQFPGTAQTVTGTVAPGETVEVVYTALQGFVIEGQSTFTHTYPSEPASVTDCAEDNQPEPLVRDRSKTRTDCDGVERREWQIVTDYVWNGSEWVLGEPEVRNDTGWVFVRNLTEAEQKQLGCLEVAGEEETAPDDEDDNEQETGPDVEVAPTQETAPTAPLQTVPTAVDAGLGGESLSAAVPPAGLRWLAPLLGGVIVLGFAGFWRLKGLAEA